jgi:hypothetical protein
MNEQVKIDRRRRVRVATAISGRLVYAGVDVECFIKQMSATSALVEVTPLPALDQPIALDVPGIGFSRGTSVRYMGESVCIHLHPDMPHEQFMSDRLDDPKRRVHPRPADH